VGSEKKYPFAVLAAKMGLSQHKACQALNISGSTAQKYQREGVTPLVADRLAVRAGYHCYTVWPDLLDDDCEDVLNETKAAEEHRTDRRRRWARTKYATDPVYRARKIDSARRYYAENAEYVKARVKRYEQENRDKINARRRERNRVHADRINAARRERRQRKAAA